MFVARDDRTRRRPNTNIPQNIRRVTYCDRTRCRCCYFNEIIVFPAEPRAPAALPSRRERQRDNKTISKQAAPMLGRHLSSGVRNPTSEEGRAAASSQSLPPVDSGAGGGADSSPPGALRKRLGAGFYLSLSRQGRRQLRNGKPRPRDGQLYDENFLIIHARHFIYVYSLT
ncbi:hypothetical protein GWI33_010195 [Rhynchophorus ferrugineus]|uniref:Uncharacterized protein n=1 Tax=Rhynchophorus ferrugineus TaxID=354439 RepID=A0A834IXG9_RHYFE|nr:hypothetical protein GWI33_010195 [Rhynchophorus ferrugineus]